MEEHLLGRMHLGYLSVREFIKKFQEKIESERAARRAEAERRERDLNRGSDRRDRDKDKDKDKERKRRYGALFASEVAYSRSRALLCLEVR